VNDADVKYLACPVCEKVAEMLAVTVSDARSAGMQVTEEALLELVSASCDVSGDFGTWLRSADYRLSDDATSFVIDIYEARGRCGAECLTMGRACAKLIEPAMVEITEALFSRDWTAEEFSHELCDEITSVCAQRRPIKNPAGRGSEPFMPMSEEELMAEYGDDDGLDGDGEAEHMDEWDGTMPPMPMVDSPLARLEGWLYAKYENATSWLRALLGVGSRAPSGDRQAHSGATSAGPLRAKTEV